MYPSGRISSAVWMTESADMQVDDRLNEFLLDCWIVATSAVLYSKPDGSRRRLALTEMEGARERRRCEVRVIVGAVKTSNAA